MNILNRVVYSYQVVEIIVGVHGLVVEQMEVMLLQQIVVLVDIIHCHLNMDFMVILHQIYLLFQ